MFDLWLNKSKEVIDEIVAEGNLKEITKKKLDEFMASDKYIKYIEQRIEIAVENALSKYIDEITEEHFQRVVNQKIDDFPITPPPDIIHEDLK